MLVSNVGMSQDSASSLLCELTQSGAFYTLHH